MKNLIIFASLLLATNALYAQTQVTITNNSNCDIQFDVDAQDGMCAIPPMGYSQTGLTLGGGGAQLVIVDNSGGAVNFKIKNVVADPTGTPVPFNQDFWVDAGFGCTGGITSAVTNSNPGCVSPPGNVTATSGGSFPNFTATFN